MRIFLQFFLLQKSRIERELQLMNSSKNQAKNQSKNQSLIRISSINIILIFY